MGFRNRVAAQRAHLTTVYVAWLLTVLVAGGLWYGWLEESRKLPVLDIPPNLTHGLSVRPGDYYEPNVYAFALSIWQAVYLWEENGQVEYPQQLFRFRPYFTPAFYEDRLEHMRRKAAKGELNNRKRALHPIPGHHYAPWRVETLGKHTWRVWLDLRLTEHQGTVPVKTPPMRYPLLVTVYDVNRNENRWGLGIAGFHGDGPRRLETDELLQVSDAARLKETIR